MTLYDILQKIQNDLRRLNHRVCCLASEEGGGGDVASVFGRTGIVVADGADYASFYQPVDGDLTAFAALAGTPGLIRKTGADAYTLDTATYLTALNINQLGAASATNTINNAAAQQEWQWNTLAGTNGLSLTSTSTAAASNAQRLFNVALSGANGTAAQTTYAGVFSNTHTGTTSVNVGIRAIASGGATANHAIETDGRVSINGATVAAGGTDAAVMIRSIDNTLGALVLHNNSNFVSSMRLGPTSIQTSDDLTINVLGGDLIHNSVRSYFGGATTPTARIHILGSTTAASTAPIKITAGTNMTTAETGAIEYNGTNLFFTRTGTTRESVICANAVNAVSPTAPNRTITVVIDGTTYYLAAKTTND